MKAELEEQRKEKDRLLASAEEKEGDLNEDLDMLHDEEEILRSQEAALEQQLAEYEAEQKRKEEEEKRRQEEEARKQAEAEAAASEARAQKQASEPTQSGQAAGGSQAPSTQEPSRSSGGTQHSKPEVTNAGFMRPATGSITSHYGPRASFGGRMHHGIDIGKNGRSGDVPIVAVQDGQVTTSQYSDSYGNYVIISHLVDGQQISTLYAHLDRLDVSAGQSVSKGQQLGLMGNTGRSYGAHLHFEVHVGGWNGQKSNSVDPMKYIP